MVVHAVRPNELVVVGPVSCSGVDLAAQTWLLREPGSGTRATAEAYLEELQITPGTLTVGSNVAVAAAAGLVPVLPVVPVVPGGAAARAERLSVRHVRPAPGWSAGV